MEMSNTGRLESTSRALPPITVPTIRQRYALEALVGVITGLVVLAVSEVISLFVGGKGSPVIAVGSFVIDIVPGWFKTFVIDVFGTADKLVLTIVLLVLVFLLAIAVGILEFRRAPLGVVLLAVIAVAAIAAVVTRADSSPADAFPTLIGAVIGVVLLRVLTRRLDAWSAVPTRITSLAGDDRRFERRKFLQLLIASGVASAVVGAGARIASAAQQAATAARAAIRLPAAASAAPVIPAGAELGITDLASYVTPNSEFYRIDTAIQVPAVDPTTWTLKIVGMVENEIEIDFADLLALPLKERIITLTCVSNEVGGNLIGNAVWLGYPIRELLARAKPLAGSDMVLSRSIDGFTAGTPLEVLQDAGTDALLAVGMNGKPLPLEHGFPVRMVVPGLYGYVSATKWVVELKVTTFAADEGYWTPRGWTALGPIKLASRIDTPRANYPFNAGTTMIAGVAWAQHTGISKVEVCIDEGAWVEAKLATVVTVDSWVQWSYEWDASTGPHRLQVRATDNNGTLQTDLIAPPAPDGSSGWHTVDVEVA